MNERTLNAWQTGSLLVSASCGVGFLMGTAELSLRIGILGCLYAVATAIGLAMLAGVAPILRKTGQHTPWAHIEAKYGPQVSKHIALLSLIWMTGVLSAQIQGTCSLLSLMGISKQLAVAIVSTLLISASFFRLSWLSSGFAMLIIGCNAILIKSVFDHDALRAWVRAPGEFFMALPTDPALAHTLAVMVSTVCMVLWGTDYQQFIYAARTDREARTGCILSALIVFALGFLPAVSAILSKQGSHLDRAHEISQALPQSLTQNLGHHPIGIDIFLFSAALGSGCAILRAMINAIDAIQSKKRFHPILLRAIPIGISLIIISRGQGLIEMMAEMNMVYIAAIIPLIIAGYVHPKITTRSANSLIIISGSFAVASYLGHWVGLWPWSSEATILLVVPATLIIMIPIRLTRRSGEQLILIKNVNSNHD